MGEAHAADTTDRLLRTQEVARWLAVSRSTLVRRRGLARRGEGALVPARRSDKWEGRLKISGQIVGTRRFETERVSRTTLNTDRYLLPTPGPAIRQDRD